MLSNQAMEMKPMITQYTRLLKSRDLKSVIRSIDIGEINGKHFIIVGMQNNRLLILSHRLKIMQKIEFSNWVRCVKTADLNKNGNSEIIVGCGDRTLRVYEYIPRLKRYTECARYTMGNFVNSCQVFDINGDGILEIIGSDWDGMIAILHYEPAESQAPYLDRSVPSVSEQVRESNLGNENGDGECNNHVDTVMEEQYRLGVKVLWEYRCEFGIKKVMAGYFRRTEFSSLKPVIAVIYKDAPVVDIIDYRSGSLRWRYEDPQGKLFNDCSFGIFDLSGNSYLVVAGDNKKALFFDENGEIIYSIDEIERISSLKIQDIDGGDHPEILLTTTSDPKGKIKKMLKVYELTVPNLSGLRLKWTFPVSGVINEIAVGDINGDGKKEIVYGGYDKLIYELQDFNYGVKEDLGLPSIAPPTAAPISPAGVIEASFGLRVHAEIRSQNGEFGEVSQEEIIIEEGIDDKKIDDMVKIALAEGDERSLFRKGYDVVEPEKAAAFSGADSSTTESSMGIEIGETGIQPGHERVAQNYDRPIDRSEAESSLNLSGDKIGANMPSIRDIIGKIFEKKNVYPSKKALLDAIEALGNVEDPVAVFEFAKSEGLIYYSRSKPRGYLPTGSSESKTPAGVELNAVGRASLKASVSSKVRAVAGSESAADESGIKAVFQSIFERDPVIARKADLISSLSNRIEGYSAEQLFEIGKTRGYFRYSRSKPRGYLPGNNLGGLSGAMAEITIAPIPSKSPATGSGPMKSPVKSPAKSSVSSAARSAANSAAKSVYNIDEALWAERIREMFRSRGVFPKKADLLDALNGLIDGVDAERLFQFGRDKNIFIYSRSKPRGYLLKDESHSITANKGAAPPAKASPSGAPGKGAESTQKNAPNEAKMREKLKEIFIRTPLFTRKAQLITAISEVFPGSDPDRILDEAKHLNIIKYSRSKPRGYSFIE